MFGEERAEPPEPAPRRCEAATTQADPDSVVAAQPHRPRRGPRRRPRLAGPHRAAPPGSSHGGFDRRSPRLRLPPPDALTEIIDRAVRRRRRSRARGDTSLQDDDGLGGRRASGSLGHRLRRAANVRPAPPTGSRRSNASRRAPRTRRARRRTTMSSAPSRASCSSSRSTRVSRASRAARRSRSTRSRSATGSRSSASRRSEQHRVRRRIQRGAHPRAHPRQERDRRRDPQRRPRDRHARRRAALADGPAARPTL